MTERSEGIPGARAPAPEQEMSDQSVLPDDTYDALVVDASALADGTIVLDVTLLDGPHKGALVTVRATGLDADALDLLALPCTLVVTDGNPHVTLDEL